MKNIKFVSRIAMLLTLLFFITSCSSDNKANEETVAKVSFSLESVTLDGKPISAGSELEVAGGERHSIKFNFSDDLEFKEDIYTIKEYDSKGNEKDILFFWKKFNPEEPKTAEIKFDALYGKKYQVIAKGKVEFAKKDEKYDVSRTVNVKSTDVVIENDEKSIKSEEVKKDVTVGGDGTPEVTISKPAPSRGVLVVEANYNQIGRSTAKYKSNNELIHAKGFEMTVSVAGTEIAKETYDKFASTIKLMKSKGEIFSLKINLDKLYKNQLEVYKKMIDGNTSVTFKVYDEPTGGKLLANITKEFNVKDSKYRYVYEPQNLEEALNQLTFGTDYYYYVPDFSVDSREYSAKFRVGRYSGQYFSGLDQRIPGTTDAIGEIYSSTSATFEGGPTRISEYKQRGSKMVQNFKFVKTGTVKASDLNLSQSILQKLKISTDIDYPTYNISYNRGSHQVWLGSSLRSDYPFTGQLLAYFHQGDTRGKPLKMGEFLLIPIGSGKFYMFIKKFTASATEHNYRIVYIDGDETSDNYELGLLNSAQITDENLNSIDSRVNLQNFVVSFPERLKWIKRYISTAQGAIAGVPPMKIRSAFDDAITNCAGNTKITNTVGVTETKTTTTTTTEEKSFSLANSSTLSTTDTRTTSTTEDHTASVSVTASVGFEAFGNEASVEVSAGYEYTNSKTQEFSSETGKENTSERSSENANGREDSTEKSVEISKEISIEVEAKTSIRARTLYYQAENVRLPVEHIYQFSAVNVKGNYISGQELLIQLQQSPGWTGTVMSMDDTSITLSVPGVMIVDNIYYSKFSSSEASKCPTAK